MPRDKQPREDDGVFNVFAAVCPFDEPAADEDDIDTLITGGEAGE